MTGPWRRVLAALFCLAPLGGAASGGSLATIQADLEAGRVAQALAALEAHLALHPGDPKARFIQGLALVHGGDEAAAIEVFKALVEDYPTLPEPYNNLAVLYASRGEYAAARDALMAAIRTHPSYATAHENLGDIYAKMAAEAYDKALALDRRNRTAQAKLALVSELASLPMPKATAGSPSATIAAGSERPGPELDPAPPPTPELPEEVLRETVARWAAAWAEQRVADYLGHYAADFVPADGAALEDWAAQRRLRLSRPERIRLAVDGLTFRALAPGVVEARFLQTYRSDTYGDRVHKVLELVLRDGLWKIRRERSRPVAE